MLNNYFTGYTQKVEYVNPASLVSSMALAHTILALLSAQDCRSGYDLSKCFEEMVGCYWQASQQQIYRELSKMEQSGWVVHETIPQEGRPDKKLYHMTEAGQAELVRWYQTPSEPAPIREDLLVKVLAAPYVPRDFLLAELNHRRQVHVAKLERYYEKEAWFKSFPELSSAQKFQYLTLRRGIRYEQAWIDWCDEVLDALKNIP